MCQVSPASPVGVVCSLPQYFKQELLFRQLTGFYFFYIPEQKGPHLVISVIKHIHSNQEYEASAHFMHVRQLLTASCGIMAQQCIIYYGVCFPSGKELALLEICNQP